MLVDQEEQQSLTEAISGASESNFREVLARISELPDVIQRELHGAQLAKNLGIRKTVILHELDRMNQQVESNGLVVDSEGQTLKALFPGLVDLVVNEQGNIAYLVNTADGYQLTESWEQDGIVYFPPPATHIKFLLCNGDDVVRLAGSEDSDLYDDILTFCKRFSCLNDEDWPIIVLSIMLSYLQDHTDVRYIPMVYFYAVAERGKSRTAKTMLAMSYRGMHLADLRPANIVRFAEHLNATLFFDITDIRKSAESSDAKDILLGRFEKGAQITRVQNPDKGPFLDQTHFNVFGSTIIATNEPADIIFESRCLSITMPNKPGRYENLTQDMAIDLKTRLTAFRARSMNMPLPVVEPIPGITGRLWDISEPLFRLAMVVAPDVYGTLKSAILDMAGHKIESKKETPEGQLVAALDSLTRGKFYESLPLELPVETVRTEINRGKPESYHISPQKLGKRIQSLSIKTRAINGRSQLQITSQELEVLKEQYGLAEQEILSQAEPTEPAAVPQKQKVVFLQKRSDTKPPQNISDTYKAHIEQSVAEQTVQAA